MATREANRVTAPQSVRDSLRGEKKRVAALWNGREQCSDVRGRGRRRKRSAGRPGAANGLPQFPDSVTLALVQHSLRGPPCQRVGVSGVDLDSPISSVLTLAVSGCSRGEGSTSDCDRRCVRLRVEFAMAFSWTS